MRYLLTILGAILIIEGIPYFAFPGRARQWALALEKLPDRLLRLCGLAAMAAGILLLVALRFF